ncbi:MAG: thiamine diphosphokinase [Chloroflexi bacterium]|nr:thiamine diphosphokinase [Chloroflexota bacterium]
MSRTILFANGELHNLQTAQAILHADDVIIAADGGAKYCRALNLTPRVIIGDLDSISPNDLAEFKNKGSRILQYPKRKDETDLELAIDLAIAEGASEIILFGALGGRWDQTLANLLIPALDKFSSTPIRLMDGDQEITLLRGGSTLRWRGHAGATVSLIPIGGEARGVTTSGLEYPLRDGVLKLGSTLGVSNVIVSEEANVSLKDGLLMCVLIKRDA